MHGDVLCPSCSSGNPAGARFCNGCGARLGPPPPLAEERKTVTTLICDLVSFTAMSEAADPEDVDALLREYFARATKAIESHGGTVEKFIGDAVVGVFGVPAVHEDDPERAVRAALRLLEALEGLIRPDGAPLQARCGVNTGEALVRLDVAPGSGEGFLTGDAVNTAARLEAAAPPGGVAVGALTCELTQRVILYDELPPVVAKGKSEPVAAWRAVAPVARRGLDTDTADLTPFVGREVELAYLTAMFDKAASQASPQFALLIGEPGIGKSRLVSQLQHYVDARPEMTTWCQGYCPPFGEDVTFWALAEIVKGHAGILDTDEPSAVEAKLDAVLPSGPDRAWFRQRLRALIGLSAAEATREENFSAWLRFFEEMAADWTTVLVFEDLHWADEALLAFLEHLASHLADVPLLVVGTARPELYERRPDFAAGGRINRLGIEPLSGAETARLVTAVLGSGDAAGSVVDRVVERCEGNPFYAEQSARLISDVAAEIALPESVQAVIAARLDALPPEEKARLADAAVVGAAFWDGALLAVADQEPQDLGSQLNGLLERRLIRRVRESSMEGEREYAFVHALAREVAYQQLPRGTRARKHAAVATWLEHKAGGRGGERAEVTAHHHVTAFELATAAGNAELADEQRQPSIDWLTVAGDRDLAVDVLAAERHFSRALALVGEEGRATPRLLWGWAMVLFATKRPREAEQVWREVVASLLAEGEPRRAALAMNELWDALQELDEPRGELSQAAVDLLADDGPSPELVEVLGDHAMSAYLNEGLPPEECRAALDRAIGMAAELDLPEPAKALGFRGAMRCLLGELEGLDDYDRAIAAATEQGLGKDLMEMQYMYAVSLFQMRGPVAALEAAERGLESARRRGDEAFVLILRMCLAWMHYCSGDWDAALREARGLEAALQATDQVFTLCALRNLEGPLLADRGTPEEAAPFLDWLVERGRTSEQGEAVVGAFGSAAAAYFGTGQVETALGLLAAVADRSAGERWAVDPAPVRMALAAGDADLARRLADAPGAQNPWRERVHLTCRALMAEARGENESALAGFADAAARWHDFGVPYEEGHALLGQGRCLMALGRAPEAAAPLAAAREIFARLGARPALEETEALLGGLAD